MSEYPSVLMVEDTPTLSVLYQEYLRREKIDLHITKTGQEALDWLAKEAPDAVLLDLKLPDMDGMDILRQLSQQGLASRVIVMTAHGSNNAALEATRLGAYDFIVKPFTAHRLQVTLGNVIKQGQLNQKVEELKVSSSARGRFCGFIGSSLPMQSVYKVIESAAPSKATIFIKGESGTGKEVAAEAIHQLSPRATQGKFVAINCAAIPKDLMESEIFGYVKGAFTGADSNHDGAAKQADGGTLFLDEIGELSLVLQSKLLRFVQFGTFRPIGGSADIKVDARIVCATNRDPLKEVEEGRFREDLYYRLHVIPLELPPLRDRGHDIVEIAQSFLLQYAKDEHKDFQSFSTDAKTVLEAWNWPGNIRELQNMLQNIIILNDGDEITANMLPEKMQDNASLDAEINRGPIKKEEATEARPAQMVTQRPVQMPKQMIDFLPSRIEHMRPLAELEKAIIEHAIKICDNNIPRAAGYLGVSPSTIYRKKMTWDE
ncbi:MAG: sigma-54-dependent transcriptional regulator [Alphaproteobacteria bacterium]